MRAAPLLQVRDLSISTPSGRPLFRDLQATLGKAERAAILGRNGVGKSTLLSVLAGENAPTRGHVQCFGTRLLVPQQLPEQARAHGLSPGQARRRALEQARRQGPDLLLLDEPTQDLDALGIAWLTAWLNEWPGALLVVSHEACLLRSFSESLVVSESGCAHKTGNFDAILAELNREKEQRERSYFRRLNHQMEQEQHQDRVRSRRERKKNLGRLHELRRCTSRARLNEKRSDAQESQGKRSAQQEARLELSRAFVKSARRALAVELPLELVLPDLPENEAPVLRLSQAGVERNARVLFTDLTLEVRRQRVAITGANGVGKSTLIEVLAGERKPTWGRAFVDATRIGYIAQASANWSRDESLVELLYTLADVNDSDALVRILRAHRFPFALAQRPLASLSPGERLRAALICVCHRASAAEVLVLDEPTQHLDFVGLAALRAALSSYRGGLVIVSHDADLLAALRVTHHIALAGGFRALTGLTRARASPVDGYAEPR